MRGCVVLVAFACGGGGGGGHAGDARPAGGTTAPPMITASATWTKDMCPITVDGLQIGTLDGSQTPVVLTIEAGCHLEMGTQASFQIVGNGALQALGTDVDPVVIEPAPLALPWADLEIDTPTPLASTRLEHVVLDRSQTGLRVRHGTPVLIGTMVRAAARDGITLENESRFDPSSSAVVTTGNGGFGLAAPIAATDQLPLTDAGNNTSGGVHLVDATVASSVTWVDVKAPYVVDTQLQVEGASSPILTLAPGVTLASPGIMVGGTAPGTLHASGSAEAPVTLTSMPTTASLWFETKAVDDQLTYTTISGGDTGVISEGVPLLLNNVTITARLGALSLRTTATLAPGSTALNVQGTTFSVEGSALAMTQLPVAGSSYAGDLWINGGTLAQSGTWHAFGPRYVLNRPVYVSGAAAPVLTIEQGVRIESFNQSDIQVAFLGQPGGLIAQGTSAAPITFSSVTKTAGAWPGLTFLDNTTASSVLDHVVVEYGGRDYADVRIQTKNASPTVTSSTIWRSAKRGIDVTCTAGAAPTIANITYGTGADANATGDLVSSCP